MPAMPARTAALIIALVVVCAAASPTCQWSKPTPGFVAGWPASTGRVRLATLADAQEQCEGVDGCNAITLNTGKYELRSGTAVQASATGETSWLLENAAACHRPGPAPAPGAPSFTIANDRFVINGTTPISMFAGEIHYSRVHPDLWDDRLARLRAMGLNSIQTYVPWNWHEATEGAFDFGAVEPSRNLAQFLRLAQRHGLLVNLRAGPYMCGEWEFGGLPAWLLRNGTIALRTYAQPYVSFVDRYWARLLAEVKPLLFSNGGPVTMVQVENEFGSYGDVSKNPLDRQYIEHLVDFAGAALGGADRVVLYTTDGGSTGFMERGSLKGGSVFTTGDGCGGNPGATWAAQKQFNPPGQSPFLCSEFYTGWLTHWGNAHDANTTAAGVAQQLDNVLSLGKNTGSVSLYMGHGGTSFGFWNGANGNGGASYEPDITSYDYDSPLAEGGEHGYGSSGHDKYAALAAVFAKHRASSGAPPPPAEPPLRPRAAFGGVPLTQRAALLDALGALTTAASTGAAAPPAMETLGCAYGFVVYEADVPADHSGLLTFPSVRDRVQVFAAGRYAGTAYRVDKQAGIPFDSGGVEAGTRLQLLVENMGRINFSRGGMADTRRGLLGDASAVLLDGKPLPVAPGGWATRCLPLEPAQLSKLAWAPRGNATSGPAFYRARFTSAGGKAGVDTYLTLPGFTKGAAWVNGFALGRHWEAAGPQKTLYVPGPVVKGGADGNELVVLELHNTSATATAVFVAAMDI